MYQIWKYGFILIVWKFNGVVVGINQNKYNNNCPKVGPIKINEKFQPPNIEVPLNSLYKTPLVIAWRMVKVQGTVECLMRGTDGVASDTYVYPVLATSRNETVSLLPNPLLIDKGIYTIRCVMVQSWDVGMDQRWDTPLSAPSFDGTTLPPTSPILNHSHSTHCAKIKGLLSGSKQNLLNDHMLTIQPGECPGLVVEASIGQSLDQLQVYHSNEVILDGPPAVIRVHESNYIVPQDKLPLCRHADEPGRWIPTELARKLVVNGNSIPTSTLRYWAPYRCRTTYWDRTALQSLASNSPSSSDLSCDLKTLTSVVFTGSSTESVLFSSLRQHILNESLSKSSRMKERDHLREQNRQIVASSRLHDNNLDISFHLYPLMMPLISNQHESGVLDEFRQQVLNITRLKPSAIILHFGLHEVCGAYGPDWWRPRKTRQHSPCASRNELIQAYRTYAMLFKEAGYDGKRLLFRTMMGTFPDAYSNRWRWNTFANCLKVHHPNKLTTQSDKDFNPCPGVASPISHAMYSGDDARLVWSDEFHVGVIDVFSIVHSSPTSDITFIDGIHPHTASDEALAINQLMLNALCHLSSRDKSRIDSIRPNIKPATSPHPTASLKLSTGNNDDSLESLFLE
jgi:hypothetical protein